MCHCRDACQRAWNWTYGIWDVCTGGSGLWSVSRRWRRACICYSLITGSRNHQYQEGRTERTTGLWSFFPHFSIDVIWILRHFADKPFFPPNFSGSLPKLYFPDIYLKTGFYSARCQCHGVWLFSDPRLCLSGSTCTHSNFEPWRFLVFVLCGSYQVMEDCNLDVFDSRLLSNWAFFCIK